jgi:hypothetical protein
VSVAAIHSTVSPRVIALLWMKLCATLRDVEQLE